MTQVPSDKASTAVSTKAEVDAFLAKMRAHQSSIVRPADLRPRRYSIPPANLGYRLPAAGRDVSGGRRDRWT